METLEKITLHAQSLNYKFICVNECRISHSNSITSVIITNEKNELFTLFVKISITDMNNPRENLLLTYEEPIKFGSFGNYKIKDLYNILNEKLTKNYEKTWDKWGNKWYNYSINTESKFVLSNPTNLSEILKNYQYTLKWKLL
jgi:hypothetical protein